jgi:hypothetical protein
MRAPEEKLPVLIQSEQQGNGTGCSRRIFLIGGVAAVLAGGGWWLSTQSSPPLTTPVDKHRIFNFPITANLPDMEYAWLPDSTHIACVTQSELFLVDVKSGQMVWKQELSSSSSNTLLIHWSTDGKRVIIVGGNETSVQDLIPGGKQIVWPGLYQFFVSYNKNELRVAFSPNETLIAVANPTVSASVRIWNIQEGRNVADYQIAQGYTIADTFDMAWAPDSTSLAVYTGWTSGTSSPPLPTLTVWRASDGHLLWTSHISNPGNNEGNRPGRIKWSPDSTALAYTYTTSLATYTTLLTVLDAKTGTIHFQTSMASSPLIQPQTDEVFVWSPDSTHLAFLVAENGRPVIQIWDAKTGQHLFSCQRVQENPGNIFWSPDGRYLVATDVDQNAIGDPVPNAAILQFWDARSGKALFSYKAPEIPGGVLWSPDSRYLAVHTVTSASCRQIAWGRSTCIATFALQVFQVG